MALPTVLMIASTAMSVIGALQQGANARAIGGYNAAIGQRNATIARDQAAADADAQRRRSQRVIGAARAGFGASGITLEGSALDVLESSAAEAELDRLNILYGGELRAMGFEDTAALDRARGQAGQRSGYMQAGSAILLGATDYYTAQEQKKTAQTGYQLRSYNGSN